MATEGTDVRISLQSLLIGLLLMIVPLSVAGLYITDRGDNALRQAIGGHFKIIADSKSDQISQFVNDALMAVGAIAAAPAVTEEVAAANRNYAGANVAATDSRIQSIQKDWNTPPGAAVAQKVLSARAARLLNRYREIDRRFLRITVTDEKGVAVAATHKPTLYFYGADDKWLAVQAGGQGAVQIADVKYDEATKANYLNIGVPILEEGSSRFLGEVQVLLDISPLAAVLNRGLTGAGPRVSLLNGAGTVIFGPDVSLSMNLKSPEYPGINEALSTAGGRETGYVIADLNGGGRNLVGFADTGLKRDYRTLDWIVLVGQDEREATAPIRGLLRFAFLMVVLGLLMLVIFGVYYYMHRHQKFMDIASPRVAVR
jgi:hypothetical protein